VLDSLPDTYPDQGLGIPFAQQRNSVSMHETHRAQIAHTRANFDRFSENYKN
jgi:hypothetical protein